MRLCYNAVMRMKRRKSNRSVFAGIGIVLAVVGALLAWHFIFTNSDNGDYTNDNKSSYLNLNNLSEMSLEGSAAIARVAERASEKVGELNEPDPIDIAVEQAVNQRNEQANTPAVDRCAELLAIRDYRSQNLQVWAENICRNNPEVNAGTLSFSGCFERTTTDPFADLRVESEALGC